MADHMSEQESAQQAEHDMMPPVTDNQKTAKKSKKPCRRRRRRGKANHWTRRKTHRISSPAAAAAMIATIATSVEQQQEQQRSPTPAIASLAEWKWPSPGASSSNANAARANSPACSPKCRSRVPTPAPWVQFPSQFPLPTGAPLDGLPHASSIQLDTGFVKLEEPDVPIKQEPGTPQALPTPAPWAQFPSQLPLPTGAPLDGLPHANSIQLDAGFVKLEEPDVPIKQEPGLSPAPWPSDDSASRAPSPAASDDSAAKAFSPPFSTPSAPPSPSPGPPGNMTELGMDVGLDDREVDIEEEVDLLISTSCFVFYDDNGLFGRYRAAKVICYFCFPEEIPYPDSDSD